jgi:hypothetical protein
MTPNDFEILLSDAEVQLSRIKHLYEQWFQGIERLEPQIARKQFDRTLHELRKVKPRNTALRFRYNTLIQRYTTLQTYWRRVARQIEEGTYRRDLLRARRRRDAARAERELARRRRSSSPVELDPEQDVDVDALIDEASHRLDALKAPKPNADARALDLDSLDSAPPKRPASPAARPAQPQPAATFRKPQPPSSRPSRDRSSPAIAAGRKDPPPIASRSKGPGDARMRQIYESYVDAKRRNHERTDKIDYETVAKSLKKMVPKLDRKHKGKRIDFEVVVKDGKVGLKPVVKK